MKILSDLVGRLLFALPFIAFGTFHFIRADEMTAVEPDFIPGGIFWVYLTGVAFIVASISIITGFYTHVIAPLMALMLLIFVFTVHLPAVLDGNMQQSMTALLKDTALAGGALMSAGAARKKEYK